MYRKKRNCNIKKQNKTMQTDNNNNNGDCQSTNQLQWNWCLSIGTVRYCGGQTDWEIE